MPPKAKITRNMVVNAAFEIARATGAENISARTVSKELNCSTQPVMYHFATIEELKKAAYEKADEYHTGYLLNFSRAREGVMLEIGLNYIRFAIEEPNLFRFLFQSGISSGNGLLEIVDSEGLMPVLSAMQKEMDMSIEQVKEIFITLALLVHGYASLIANNSWKYDEELIAAHLKRVYTGAVSAIREETK